MEEKGLSIGVLLKQSWTLFKNNWVLLITTLIAAGAVAFSPIVLEVLLFKPVPIVVALLELLKTLLTIWMFLGLLKIYIALVKGERAQFADLFRGVPMVLNFLVSQLVLGAMMVVAVALVLLVVGGPLWIYLEVQGQDFDRWLTWWSQQPEPYSSVYNWAMIFIWAACLFPVLWIASRFMLMPFFIVDCYEGPVEALKMAGRAARGVTWDLFTLLVVTIVFLIIGFALFGVGLLFTIPIIYIAQTYAYFELIETTSWKGSSN